VFSKLIGIIGENKELLTWQKGVAKIINKRGHIIVLNVFWRKTFIS